MNYANLNRFVWLDTALVAALFAVVILCLLALRLLGTKSLVRDYVSAGLFVGAWVAYSWIGQSALGDRVLTPTVFQIVGVLIAASCHLLLLRWWLRNRSEALYVLCLWLPWVLVFALKLFLPVRMFQLVGLSYICFRMSLLALELRKDTELQPSFGAYISHLLFFPTIAVGPINSYSNFKLGWKTPAVLSGWSRSLARILVGYVMFKLLAPVVQQLGYPNILNTGHIHNWGTVVVSGYCYLAYLYFNFAGACHMAIGAAGLAGYPVRENFNNPILSKNIKDFWTRWHITLSELARDMLFTPINVWILRATAGRAQLFATVVAAFATFVLIGLWHHVSLALLIFGLLHGAGFSAVVMFEALMRRMGWHRARLFKTIAWRVFATWATLSYVAFSLYFVAMAKDVNERTSEFALQIISGEE